MEIKGSYTNSDRVQILIGLAFLISLAYNFSFLAFLGLLGVTVPLTAGDIIITYTHWLPRAMFCLIPVFLMAKISSLGDKNISEEEILKESNYPNLLKHFRTAPYYFFILIAIFFILYTLSKKNLNANEIYHLGYSSTFIICILYARISNINFHKERFSDLVFYPKIIMVACLMLSITSAYVDTKKPSGECQIVFSNISSQPSNATCIRSLTLGVIIQENRNKFSFIPWENILSLKYTSNLGINSLPRIF